MVTTREMCPVALSIVALEALLFVPDSDASAAGPRVLAQGPPGDVVLIEGRKGTRTYKPDAVTGTPSETSASTPGDKSLDECLQLWDAATHMSKAEWRAACVRVLRNRTPKPES